MKKLSALAVLLAAATPALAQSAPAGLYTCWYSAAGKLTGTQPAASQTERVHYLVLTGRGGDQAWAYAIRSTDGHECPKLLPRS